MGNTPVARGQPLAEIPAAARNTSTLQESAASHDGLYR